MAKYQLTLDLKPFTSKINKEKHSAEQKIPEKFLLWSVDVTMNWDLIEGRTATKRHRVSKIKLVRKNPKTKGVH